MKYSILLIVVAWSIQASAQYKTDPEDGSGPDKGAHFAITAAISSCLYLGLRNADYSRERSFATAFLTTMALGVIKEATDPKFSMYDIRANTIGSMAPVFLISF